MSLLARVVRGLTYVAMASFVAVIVLSVVALATDLSSTYPYVALGAFAVSVASVIAYVMVLKRSDRLYRREVARGLDAAFANPEVPERSFDLDTGRLVVLSDQHKGTRDGADDFWRSERAYCAALAYYFGAGYHLVCLGDAEELWETLSPQKVIRKHNGDGQALSLEARFNAAGRYDRVWGNHDLIWMTARNVATHLGEGGPFGAGFAVNEAVKFNVTAQGEHRGTLFLLHGHQGTADSQVITAFSQPVVRFFGFLQRRFKRGWNTPASDWALRARHDAAMFAWAKTRSADRVVLIAGHTHRPVFWDRKRPIPTGAEVEQLAGELRADEQADAPSNGSPEKEADLEWARAEQRWGTGSPPPQPIEPPCYFNTGCCSFADGDITGLEIVGGEIRLIRWPNDQGEARPKTLEPATARLSEVFDGIGKYGALARGDGA
jgi:predicted phosphodiesterase